MRNTLIALCLAGATVLTPLNASAETLTFGTGNSEQHPINQRFFIPWSDKVNAEADGQVEINLRHGKMLVNATNYVDRITDDVIQIGWGIKVFNPGRFPRSLVSTVPFIEGSAEAAAIAYCSLYESGVFDEELSDLVPLFFVNFPQSSAHLNGSPLTSMSDLDGKKIMVGSPIQSQIVSAYGGTPLSIIVPEHYQSLQRNTAEGSFMTFTAFPGFKLDEVTTDHLSLPLGGATGMAFMSRERYDSLSDGARAVIDANSGCEVTRQMGATVDQWETDSRGYVQSKGDHTFSVIDPDELDAMREKLGAGIEAGFGERVPDGAAILKQWKAAMASARTETGEAK